jgi:hypothetical protein
VSVTFYGLALLLYPETYEGWLAFDISYVFMNLSNPFILLSCSPIVRKRVADMMCARAAGGTDAPLTTTQASTPNVNVNRKRLVGTTVSVRAPSSAATVGSLQLL